MDTGGTAATLTGHTTLQATHTHTPSGTVLPFVICHMCIVCVDDGLGSCGGSLTVSGNEGDRRSPQRACIANRKCARMSDTYQFALAATLYTYTILPTPQETLAVLYWPHITAIFTNLQRVARSRQNVALFVPNIMSNRCTKKAWQTR